MVEKIWANSYILYGLTKDEEEYVQQQLKRFNKIDVDIFNDIYAYPAFLIIINPSLLTNEEVKEFNKKYFEWFNEDTSVYFTVKDNRILNKIYTDEKLFNFDKEGKKILSDKKRQIEAYGKKNCFFSNILLNGNITLIAGRPCMGRKRLAIELAEKYMDIFPYNAYVFCVQALSEEYLDKINLKQHIEFFSEQEFEEICNFIELHSKENIFCVIADFDLIQNANIKSLYECIEGTDSKIVITQKCSRDLENRDDLHPKVSDIVKFNNIRPYVDNVVLIYRPNYYYPRMNNKIEISLHNSSEITNEKFEFYWDFNNGLSVKKDS